MPKALWHFSTHKANILAWTEIMVSKSSWQEMELEVVEP